jgi:hypothetical protein
MMGSGKDSIAIGGGSGYIVRVELRRPPTAPLQPPQFWIAFLQDRCIDPMRHMGSMTGPTTSLHVAGGCWRLANKQQPIHNRHRRRCSPRSLSRRPLLLLLPCVPKFGRSTVPPSIHRKIVAVAPPQCVGNRRGLGCAPRCRPEGVRSRTNAGESVDPSIGFSGHPHGPRPRFGEWSPRPTNESSKDANFQRTCLTFSTFGAK